MRSSGGSRALLAVSVSVLVVVSVLSGAGCAERQLTRAEIEDRYIDGVVDAGIERSVAECVITRLFGEMTDAELREFNTEGSELTDEQSVRLGELTAACGG
jgi:hypothetical protein